MNKPFTPLKLSAPVRSCPVVSTDQIRPDERTARKGLTPSIDSPSLPSFTRELFQILDGGVASCPDPGNGIPWRRPRIETLAALARQYDSDLCLKAAKEAREIVQSQDRAPNISGLFEKKLRDLAEVRSAVSEALA